jgi:hypothetical protein
MACRGVHFAITMVDADRLLTAPNDDAVLEIVQDDIEERWDKDWLYQSDKAWDAIHRCLCDGTLDPAGGTYPLKLAVLNGRQIYSRDDYIVSSITPDEVRDVAIGLAGIDRRWLKSRYDALDPDAYGLPKSEDDWEYTWMYFSGLVPFFQNAATANRYVLFSVDQ